MSGSTVSLFRAALLRLWVLPRVSLTTASHDAHLLAFDLWVATVSGFVPAR